MKKMFCLVTYFISTSQAIFNQTDQGTQTTWKYPRNANVQTYPREFTEDEQQQLVKSDGCKKFVHSVSPE